MGRGVVKLVSFGCMVFPGCMSRVRNSYGHFFFKFSVISVTDQFEILQAFGAYYFAVFV